MVSLLPFGGVFRALLLWLVFSEGVFHSARGVVPHPRYTFNLLSAQGIREIYVNVYYLADALLGVYGEETRINGAVIRLSREEQLMGTAGDVKRLAENFDDTFLVVMGDALTDVDVRKIVTFHKEKDALATIALSRVYDPSQYGVVDVDGAGNIVGFQEKPEPEEVLSTVANTGIYVLEPRVLDYVPDNTFFDFARDVFPKLLEAKERFVGFEGEFYWSDIGTLEAYRRAQYDVLSGKVQVKVPGEQQNGRRIWVGKNAQIHPTVHLDGCVAIGRDAVVGRNVVLSGDVTVGNDCWVWPEATIKRSILLPGGSVGNRAYLEDCIVGHGYDVRPGETIRGGALIRRRS